MTSQQQYEQNTVILRQLMDYFLPILSNIKHTSSVILESDWDNKTIVYSLPSVSLGSTLWCPVCAAMWSSINKLMCRNYRRDRKTKPQDQFTHSLRVNGWGFQKGTQLGTWQTPRCLITHGILVVRQRNQEQAWTCLSWNFVCVIIK